MNKRMIDKDLTIKILSVMLALLLWFYVITEQNPEMTKDVTIPVRLINTVFLEKNNMVLVGDSTDYKLTIRIKGKKNVLDKVNESTVDAFADFEGHSLKGENYLKINIVGIPEGADIISKSAENLKVLLESRISVQKSVQLNIMGNPSHGMAAMTPTMVPNDVVITGAESQINKIKSVRVDVDIASVNSEVRKILPVRVLDEKGKDVQNITIDPGNVEVSIPIEETKSVKLDMNISGQPAAGYMVSSYSVQPSEILITGKQQALEGINTLKTEVIDINEGIADISKEVKLILPEGIQIVNSNEKINVSIKIEKIVTKEIDIEDIGYVNLADNLEPEGVQEAIKATVRGAESQVNDVPVKFYVDLRDAAEGTNVMNVLWDTPKGVEIIDISPEQISVVLKKKSVEAEPQGDD